MTPSVAADRGSHPCRQSAHEAEPEEPCLDSKYHEAELKEPCLDSKSHDAEPIEPHSDSESQEPPGDAPVTGHKRRKTASEGTVPPMTKVRCQESTASIHIDMSHVIPHVEYQPLSPQYTPSSPRTLPVIIIRPIMSESEAASVKREVRKINIFRNTFHRPTRLGPRVPTDESIDELTSMWDSQDAAVALHAADALRAAEAFRAAELLPFSEADKNLNDLIDKVIQRPYDRAPKSAESRAESFCI
jgi:hypothetical protein